MIETTSEYANNAPKDEHPKKTLGNFGSIVLLTNNMTGPAMMGLPFLFRHAGIIPVVCSVGITCVCASLCGTLLADTIAHIPGNSKFTKHIMFSNAFHKIIGGNWYYVAETLFLSSCMIQACAGIVETTHSLDGLLASFLIGKTYALQILPTVSFISWSSSECQIDTFEVNNSPLSTVSQCVPFSDDGPLVITLGFLLVTLLFMPFGFGHLKETMIAQYISFAFLLILSMQFSVEFLRNGLYYPLPWFGNDMSKLTGIILYNFTVTLTVPSWLDEKIPAVSVNKSVWSATTLCSLLYLGFGSLAAMAFNDVSEDILSILSSKRVHLYTRLCAALFGIIIIGVGIPVFCVIMKSAIIATGKYSKNWGLFWGSFFPFLVSWMLCQGSVLLNVMNWSGLVINGTVAFILPLLLTLYSLNNRNFSRVDSSTFEESSESLSTKILSPLISMVYGIDRKSSVSGKDEILSATVPLAYSSTNNSSSGYGSVDAIRQYGSVSNNRDVSSRSINTNSKIGDCNSNSSNTGIATSSSSGTRILQTVVTHGTDDVGIELCHGLSPPGTWDMVEGTSGEYEMTEDDVDDATSNVEQGPVRPLPSFLYPYRKTVVLVIVAIFAFVILSTIIVDVENKFVPPEEDPW